jgi:hypothetical protein
MKDGVDFSGIYFSDVGFSMATASKGKESGGPLSSLCLLYGEYSVEPIY